MTAAPIDSTAPPSNAAGPAVVTVGSVGDGDDLLTIFSAAISQGDPAVQSVNTLSPATVAAVGGVLRFQHHRSCGAASRPRRLPRGIVCDGDADPPRAKLRDYGPSPALMMRLLVASLKPHKPHHSRKLRTR